jgi:DNA-binding XRE family transcriptional regulator
MDGPASRRFRRELRQWRESNGLTQRGLADLVRFSRETVAAVESGRRYGSWELAVRCDDVLRTGGVLTTLWPQVAAEQVAADRRRGPRPAAVPRQRAPMDDAPRALRASVAELHQLRELIDRAIAEKFQAAEGRG